MSQDLSEPTALQQDSTWRSTDGAPDPPEVDDARSLLATVDRPTIGDCVLVRLALDGGNRADLCRVRDWLRTEDTVVATGIGPEEESGGAGTVDVLVEPGYDVDTVGQALSDVGEVDAVAAATFETADPRRDAEGADGAKRSDDVGRDEHPFATGEANGPNGTEVTDGVTEPADSTSSGRDNGHSGDVDQDDIDEVFATLREEVEPVPYDSLVEELAREDLAGADVDLTPLLDEGTTGQPSADGEPTEADGPGGPAWPVRSEGAAEPGQPTWTERPVETDGRGGVRASPGGGSDERPPEWIASRLDAIERRIAGLEDRLDDTRDAADAGDATDARAGGAPAVREAAPQPTASQGRRAGSPTDPASIPERLSALEAAVSELSEEQQRLRRALLGEGG